MMRAAAASLLTLTLAGCGASESPDAVALTSTPTPTPTSQRLLEATTLCLIPETAAADSKSATIRIEGRGVNPDAGHTFKQLDCLLEATSAPSYVKAHMDSTRALDGTQEDQWGSMKARWTYHPDDGLNVTILDLG